MQHSSEFLIGQIAFAKRVVVVEELTQSDPVFLNLLLNVIHQSVQLSIAVKVLQSASVSSFRLASLLEV